MFYGDEIGCCSRFQYSEGDGNASWCAASPSYRRSIGNRLIAECTPIIPSLQASILFSEGYGEDLLQRFLAIEFSCRGSSIQGLGLDDGFDLIVHEYSLRTASASVLMFSAESRPPSGAEQIHACITF
jgi:hypothetical protein